MINNNYQIIKYYPHNLLIFFTPQQLDSLILDERIYQRLSQGRQCRKHIFDSLKNELLFVIAFLILNKIYSKEEVIQSFFDNSSLRLLTIELFTQGCWQDLLNAIKTTQKLINNKLISRHAIRSMINGCESIQDLDVLLSFANRNVFLLEKNKKVLTFIKEAKKILPFGKSLTKLITQNQQIRFSIEYYSSYDCGSYAYEYLVIPKAHPVWYNKDGVSIHFLTDKENLSNNKRSTDNYYRSEIHKYYHNEQIKLLFKKHIINKNHTENEFRLEFLLKSRAEQQKILAKDLKIEPIDITNKQVQSLFKIINNKEQKEFLSQTEETKFHILYRYNLPVKIELANPDVNLAYNAAQFLKNIKPKPEGKINIDSIMQQPHLFYIILKFLTNYEKKICVETLTTARLKDDKEENQSFAKNLMREREDVCTISKQK